MTPRSIWTLAALLSALVISSASADDDHLKCFKVHDQLRHSLYKADLSALVPQAGCTVVMPAALVCLPSEKTNVTPPPPGAPGGGPTNGFACYRVRCPRASFPPVVLSDQFGTRNAEPVTTKMLCAPLTPPGAPPPTTTTSTMITITSTTSTTLSCPYTGPPVFNPTAFAGCNPACSGAHCVPTSLLGSLPVSPDACTASGSVAGECVPDPIIAAAGQFVPKSCSSTAGAEGRCLSTCLPAVAAAVAFPQANCAAGERCMPCFDPTASDPTAPTGACSFACDAPAQPPTLLTCPWNGPPVFAPTAFAGCSPACSGAHCVPAGIVPPALQSLLATCTGGLCEPDPLIATAGNYVPPSCIAFAGTTAEGRCLSTCLPGIAAQSSLEQSTCTAGNKCAPCTNPYTGASTGSCTTSCDAPAQPAFTFPGCCVFNSVMTGTCVPSSQIPAAQQSSFVQDVCPGGSAGYLCEPNEDLPGGAGPSTCTDLLLGAGVCFSRCLNLGVLSTRPQDDCPANHVCVPCSLAPTTPGCPG